MQLGNLAPLRWKAEGTRVPIPSKALTCSKGGEDCRRQAGVGLSKFGDVYPLLRGEVFRELERGA